MPARTRRKKEAPALPAPAMEDFHTRSKANEGHRIPLYAADGRLTAHWLRVRGIDSDAYRTAYTKQTRRTAEIAAMPEADRPGAILDATLEMQASLVVEWSFDKPCTVENVKAFFREAPQIADKVAEFANRRTFFFKTPLEGFMPTQAQSSP